MVTTLHEYTTVDKSTWGHGPWQGEPDKLQWIDEATGLDCLIVRGPSGALCGYVGVPEGHPYFGVEYHGCTITPACGEDYCGHRPERAIEVHGGLTFSDFCHEGPPECGICHTPVEGRPDRVWWLGFDCAHSGDLTPKYAADPNWPIRDGWYKSRKYVEREVVQLAAQLKRIGDGLPPRENDDE